MKLGDRSSSSVPGRLPALEVGLIVLAVVLAYSNSFAGPFVFDDTKSIVGNESLRHWSQAWFPPPDLGVAGRPVLNLSLAVNFQLGGVRVAGYHLVNLLIHLLAALTLYGLARRTLPSVAGRSAFWIGLLWSLHPVQTSSVTYLIQRAESLMGLFYLITLYAFARYAAAGSRKVGWAVIAIAACALGMGTKEVMVTAPFLVLLYDRAFLSGSFGAALRRNGWVYAGLAGSWLFLGALIAGLPARGTGYGYGVSAWSYALTEAQVIVSYLRLVAWPYPLVLDYNFPIVRDFTTALPYLLLVLALISAWAWALWRRPALGFVGAVFFVILAPTSSFVPVALQPMAENRLYLPLAALVVLVVLAAQRWPARVRLVGGTALAVIWGALTFARNEDYRSEDGIWADTVRQKPDNPRALYNLGTVRLKAGKPADAIPVLERSAGINPADAEVLYNLGLALAGAGHWEESVKRYQEALKLRPAAAGIQNNLGIALMRLGRNSEALVHFAAAVRNDPNLAEASANWGNALYAMGQPAEASRHLAEAVRLQPNIPRLHIRLAMALAQAGDPQQAIEQFQEALRLQPDDSDTRANLEMLLRATGQSAK